MKKQNKGITLIALIITITILLILTALIIDTAIDGELFDTAKESREQIGNDIDEKQSEIDEILNIINQTESMQLIQE